MISFEDWWAGVRMGVAPSVSLRQARAMCKLSWETSGKQRPETNVLAQWENMAGQGEGSGTGLTELDEINSMLRNEPPKDVEDLIKRLNTRGGRCYLEHAEMIRNFIMRLK